MILQGNILAVRGTNGNAGEITFEGLCNEIKARSGNMDLVFRFWVRAVDHMRGDIEISIIIIVII